MKIIDTWLTLLIFSFVYTVFIVFLLPLCCSNIGEQQTSNRKQVKIYIRTGAKPPDAGNRPGY
jgi:hypothetical protein